MVSTRERGYHPGMPRFMVVRSFEVGESEMPVVGRRSRQLIENEFPEITWEQSHVVVGDDGNVRTYCIYVGPDEDVVRAHSSRLGQHKIDAIGEIAGEVTPADFPPV